ncbi:MAG: glycine oxidase ThiO [Synechococcales cyanobacterium RU_4_20]|nr:glycine oxidase ThiO [Synechococcales cyanobacterium RU_4_20]NJR67376.1 glycine oxidase ThiO [Synechococcales cyanobacterium CRU_2_2]
MAMAIALELRLRGASVSILSRDRSAAAAYAAAGMLAPQAEKLQGSMAQLCLRSRDLYPDWTAKLEALSGLETGYWASGILNPVFASEVHNHTPALTTAPADSEQTPTQWLDRSAVRQQQPGLSPEVIGGWWFPKDAQVDNRRLVAALTEALRQVGVVWHEGVTVTEIEVGQGRQVRAIATDQGRFTAAHYVLAAGAWSRQLWDLPVSPRKGQMLSVQVHNLQARDLQAQDSSSIQPLRQVLYGDHIYIVPRQDGLIVVGATLENVEFTAGNTPTGLHQLLGEAIRLYPQLQDFPLVETWWGYRPTTPDELPILGPSSLENLTLATGHHRNGILLAPITAQWVTDWILEQNADALLPDFRWDRF